MARKRSILERVPLAPVFAGLFGAAAAVLVAATPQWLFEATVVGSGLADAVTAAQPPLGLKARVLAILLAGLLVGGLVGLVVWVIERALTGPRLPSEAIGDDDVRDTDEATAAPLAPDAPRRPIFAGAELGAPLMSEAALRRDEVLPPVVPPEQWNLDDAFEVARRTPLDPDQVLAIDEPEPDNRFVDDGPAVVALPVAAEAPGDDPTDLSEPLDLAEFALPPAPDTEPERLPGETSIEALLRRLEAGLARRGPPRPRGPGPAARSAPSRPDWLAGDDAETGTTRAMATLQRMVG